MCDKWKYTFIFYDVKNQGVKYQIKESGLEKVLNQLVTIQNERFYELKRENKISTRKGNRNTFIYGTFTNWEPRKMMLVDELCAYL